MSSKLQSSLGKSAKNLIHGGTQQLYSQHNMNKYGQKASSFLPEGEKINFQSQDSQGSDISYQSSIQSEQDINIGEIQYFKEEMGRFFINYPQLINNQIFQSGQQSDQLQYENENNQLKHLDDHSGLNKNWNLLADQILVQAKQSGSFLQSLSRRIALYRSKTHQQDLIDVLLKEEKNIIKEIELEINLKKKQIKGNKNYLIDHSEPNDNLYFSWRKKKQLQNQLYLQKSPQENYQHSKNYHSLHKNQSKTLSVNKRNADSNKKVHPNKTLKLNERPQHKNQDNTFFLTSNNQSSVTQGISKTSTGYETKPYHQKIQRTDSKSITSYQPVDSAINKRSFSLNKNQRQRSVDRQKPSNEEGQKEVKPQMASSTSQNFWKHLVNFEPRTQAGRQLCQLIRKTNSPNDQLGIKKTIMQFLSRNKEMVQNELILKSTISQKIQKLYNDDSKQLLMFYPTKMSPPQTKPNGIKSKQDIARNILEKHSNPYTNSNNLKTNLDDGDNYGANGKNHLGFGKDNELDATHKLFDQGQKFMNLLQDIVEGPLMKYWMMIQQKKL